MDKINITFQKMIFDWRFLNHQWSAAITKWRDKSKERFEKEFWDEFKQVVPTVFDKIKELNEIIQKAQRDLRT